MSCPECFKGRVRTDATPTGHKTTIHGLNCYVAAPPSGKPSKGIVVIVPDAFGWELVNNQLLADAYAQQGDFEVYLPDFMDGHSAPLWLLDELESVLEDTSLRGIATKPYHVAGAVYGFAPFLVRNRLSVTMPRVASFLSGLRTDPATAALPVGVAGFCWGGQHVVRLCADAPELAGATKHPAGGLVDAGFVAHPSNWKVPAEVELVRKPLAIAAGGADKVTAPEVLRQAKAILDGNGVRAELEEYEGAGHGWSVRVDRKNPRQKEQAEDCERFAVRWFTETFAQLSKAKA